MLAAGWRVAVFSAGGAQEAESTDRKQFCLLKALVPFLRLRPLDVITPKGPPLTPSPEGLVFQHVSFGGTCGP